MKKVMLLAATVMLSAILIVGSALALQPNPPGLAELALQPEEFPSRSELSGEGPITPDDVTQPLNPSNSLVPARRLREVEAFLYRYREGYKVEQVVWDGQFSAFVGNYLYQYADSQQAQAVAQAICEFLQTRSGSLVYDQSRTNGEKVQGWAGIYRGSEGNTIHWFVGTKGDVLILLIVDGLPSAQATFETLVTHLLTR